MTEPTPYALMGGADAFRRLVHRFYVGVADDPVLRPLYPEEDLGPPRSGCGCSSSSTGAARRPTRAAGAPPAADAARAVRASTPVARDAWLQHMGTAVDALGLAPSRRTSCGTTSTTPRTVMVNAPDEPAGRRHVRDGATVRCVVARRRRLPGLPAQLRRLRRRRHRRPAGHPRRGCPTCRPRRRRDLADPVLPLAAWPTAATTSPTTATSTRCSARWPTSTRWSPRRTRTGSG